MLEDKTLGIVIAESEDEEFWIACKKNAELQMKELNKQLKFVTATLEMIEGKIQSSGK